MRRHHRPKDASKILEAQYAAYPAWKIEAAKELQRRHDIAATAIPERVWANLFMRGLNPQATADRAEIYHGASDRPGRYGERQRGERATNSPARTKPATIRIITPAPPAAD